MPHHYTDRMGRTIVVPPGFYQFLNYMLQDAIQEDNVIATPAVAPIAMESSPGLLRMDPVLQPSSPKKKRRVSKYQREFGRQLKALKRKHPRTSVTRLMKRAHGKTKKAMRRR